ncbi:MAG: c-type cytochrome [Chloroflexota bacterium]
MSGRFALLWFLSLFLIACSTNDGPIEIPSAEALAGGDATSGEQVFMASCAQCHAITDEMRTGPGMAGLFQPEGPTRPAGIDYGSNLPTGEPINEENVARFILEGGRGEIAYMPPSNLDTQQVADLIAYLRTLER